MTLLGLTQEYMQILDMATEGEDPEIIQTHLEIINDEFEEKADRIAYCMTWLEGYTKTIKEEEERLAARRKAIENNRERLKDYLQNCMIATNKLKFKTAMHSFGIQKNPQSVRLIEGEKIPDIYLIPQEPKVDKRAILSDLKAGKELRFAELYQTESLRIR